MKFLFIPFFFILFLLSCSQETEVEAYPGITLRALDPATCESGIINSDTLDKIDCFDMVFYSGDISAKNRIDSRTFTRQDISSSMKIKGLDDMKNVTILFSAYTAEDRNNPKWQGIVRNVSFKKGKTTALDLVLYPTSGSACLPEEGHLNIATFGHSAALLPDGRVVVAGGFTSCVDNSCEATDRIEIVDPTTGRTTLSEKRLSSPRGLHQTRVLNDGSLLIVGGVKRIKLSPAKSENRPVMPFLPEEPVFEIEMFTPSVLKGRDWTGDRLESEDKIEPAGNIEDSVTPWQSFANTQESIIISCEKSVYSLSLDSTSYNLKIKGTPGGLPLMAAVTEVAQKIISAGGREYETPSAYLVSEKKPEILEGLPNLYFASSFSGDSYGFIFGGSDFNGELTSSKMIYRIDKDLKIDSAVIPEIEITDFMTKAEGNGIYGAAGSLNDGSGLLVTFDDKLNVSSTPLFYGRTLSAAVVTPSGMFIVIGGTSSLSSPEPTSAIEVVRIKK